MNNLLIFFILITQISFAQEDSSTLAKPTNEYFYFAYLGNRDFPTYNISVSVKTIDFNDVIRDSSFTSKMKYHKGTMKETFINQDQFNLLKQYIVVQDSLYCRSNLANQKDAKALSSTFMSMVDYGMNNNVYKISTFYSLPEYINYLNNLICFARRNAYPDEFITYIVNQRYGILYSLDRFAKSVKQDFECY